MKLSEFLHNKVYGKYDAMVLINLQSYIYTTHKRWREIFNVENVIKVWLDDDNSKSYIAFNLDQDILIYPSCIEVKDTNGVLYNISFTITTTINLSKLL
jgi:hypothetical protein